MAENLLTSDISTEDVLACNLLTEDLLAVNLLAENPIDEDLLLRDLFIQNWYFLTDDISVTRLLTGNLAMRHV